MPRTTPESPQTYLAAIYGLALLRSFRGELDPATSARLLDGLRALLADTDGAPEVMVAHLDSTTGYSVWAPTYDSPNDAFGHEAELLSTALASGVEKAVDAACGTGRIAAMLARHGVEVIGVDSSPDMLSLARRQHPDVDLRSGELTALPVDDHSVDLVTCSLALTHVPNLDPVFAEFTRVLRPGGRVVTADVHPELVALRRVPTVRSSDGSAARIESYVHRVGDYVRAALGAGLTVLDCLEPNASRSDVAPAITPSRPVADGPGPWHVWPWSLDELAPEAADLATAGLPGMLLFEFGRRNGHQDDTPAGYGRNVA